MAKLIDLFNEREPELYNYVKYPYKEDDDTQPYRYTTLDNAEPMNNTFFEDQSNPVSLSARRDFNRMFQFSKSAQGLVFLGKQTFLQTGNTFAQTRLYNPLNVQIHSVPFVHMSRHVDVKQTVESLFGGTSDPERYARLQNETSDAAKVRGISRAEGKAGILKIDDDPPTVSTRGFFDNIFGSLINTANNFASGFSAQFTNPTGDRPDINFYDRMVGVNRNLRNHYWFDRDSYRYMDDYVPLIKGDSFPSAAFPNKLSLKFRYQDDNVDPVRYSGDELPIQNIVDYGTILPFALENKKYAQEVSQYLSSSRGGGKNISIASPGTPTNGLFTAYSRDGGTHTTERPSYYQDLTQINKSVFKSNIPFKDDVDSIDIIFDAGPGASLVDGITSSRVRFRAFLEDLSETVTPTYNENKYIGRYETFYTYNKVIRDVSFKLTLHAFSKEELDHIHRKMSYLTSLAYPEVTNNYLTPNIFKITIGQMYYQERCILQSLSHTIDNDVSWDIDRERPHMISSNIGIRILDKKIHYISEETIYGREIVDTLEGNLPNVSQ